MKRSILIAVLLLALSMLALPSFAASSDEDPSPAFSDGRMNSFDVAAPVAVYVVGYDEGNGLDFWTPTGFEGAGELSLRVTGDDIAKVDANPESATLIASAENGTVSLYRLPDGSFQVLANAGTSGTYSLIFETLGANTGYSSTWLK
jgi:hypothetical protein